MSSEVKKRLGRGLDSLLSSTRIHEIEEEVRQSGPDTQIPIDRKFVGTAVVDLPIDKIHRNPHQPRQNWDDGKLFELAESIKANGLIQPILVRQMGDGYQLIAGERRLRAMRMVGLQSIPSIVKQASEEQVMEWALIENIHRSDLSVLERANAYEHYIKYFSLTQQQAAERLGEDRSTIANYIRLRELPEEIKSMLQDGILSMGQARALLGVSDAHKQVELAEVVVKKNMSVRELEKRVKLEQQEKKPTEKTENKNANIIELERELTRSTGTKVTIKTMRTKQHRGSIVIEFYNLDDFDRIKERLL